MRTRLAEHGKKLATSLLFARGASGDRVMRVAAAILDAGPLISLWGRVDKEKVEHRAWAQELFQKFSGPFFTTEMVLSEVAHLTGRDLQIIELVRSGYLLIDASLKEDAPAIERCLMTYPYCDLADASVLAVSERRLKLKILTTDRRHFSTYRRRDKSAPELELP